MRNKSSFPVICLGLVFPLLTLAAGLQLGSKLTAPPEANQLPPAREIIQRYVEAIGGQDAILRRKSAHITGKYVLVGQFTADLEVFAAAPNRVLATIRPPGMEDIQRGFDGKVGWEASTKTRPSLVKGKALAQMRHEAEFYSELHEEKTFQRLETVGREAFDGKQCYKLRLVTQTGHTYLEFFDVENHLQVGRVATIETPAGPTEATTVLTGYRRFGEVLSPTEIYSRYAIGGRTFVEKQTYTSIEYNTVDAAVFELPGAVKALLKTPRR